MDFERPVHVLIEIGQTRGHAIGGSIRVEGVPLMEFVGRLELFDRYFTH